jgi:hypothetical protein
MIRAFVKGNDGEASILFLGLTEEAVTKLQSGKGVMFSEQEMARAGMDPPAKLYIVYGQTEEEIAGDLTKAGVYVETVYEDRNGGLRSERSSGHS